jgi:tRNA nucleotidyltransferase (CCA-adding enzyme)
MQTFLVGGWVRDLMLRRPGRDRDRVVVGATPDDMLARGFVRVGKDFPVFLHPGTREEYALARSGRGGADRFDPDVALEEDLRHRDFTINAMAMDADGALIDPVGGARDVAAGIIRHLGNGLWDDPLRVLRGARFAAQLRGFTVAPGTLAEMGRVAAGGGLAALAPGRIWPELDKALGTPNPSRFFLVLRSVGALAPLFPEIDRLFGVPQRADTHPEIDTGVHAMMVLDCAARLSRDTAVRFAALVHDLGKGSTPVELLPRHHGHEERGGALVETLVRRCAGPKRHAELGMAAARLHGLFHTISDLRPGTVLEVLTAADAFRRPERLEALLLVAEADRRGRLGHGDDPYPQAALWRRALAAAAGVTGGALVADGHHPGSSLAPVLFQRRAEAIRALPADLEPRPPAVPVTGPVELPTRLRITDVLEEIEREEVVTILFAVESGSRAWGFPSPDSDFDVRFVYVRPPEWYLSLTKCRDVIERPIVDDLDLAGWDLKKALALLLKGHPVLLEWLNSPIVYLERPETASLREFAARSPYRRAAAHHYRSLARHCWQDHIDGRETVALKKYLYGLRPAAALCWLRTNGVGRLPMDLPTLLAEIAPGPVLSAEIDGLLSAKAASSELGSGARLPAIDAFVAGELERAAISGDQGAFAVDPGLRVGTDALFRSLVLRFSGNR